HPNGRALVDRLRDLGPVTIVLDECHHLLEVWGRLVAEVLDLLPDAFVLGLTATPPSVLDRNQRALVDELFGDITYAASIPAAVREGTLAPFAELARITTPTPTESQWLAGQSERFTRLTTDLMEPGFGTVGLLEWLDRRYVRSGEPWHDLERRTPTAAAAALRLAYAGLLATPPGARLREEHRHPPSADDWVALIDDWVSGCLLVSKDLDDAEIVERIRRTLPGVGYQWTRRGIRRGRSPVDRVLARSAAKADECVEVVASERSALADRLRLLVVCDHERASATTPESLDGVLDPESGSARLLLRRLVEDDRTAGSAPVLMTGSTVATADDTADRLLAFVRDRDPDLAAGLRVEPWSGGGIVSVVGGWSSRDWVRLVTSFFEQGSAQVLVGTRALLGEGWDARGLNSLVDLSSATTVSAVVQTRGRALRTDPQWAEKVALTWSIVCITEDHPRGTTDWDRFVRKHDGYFGVDDDGDIVSGVSHVDARLSPYAPPAGAELAALNASMLVRAESRAEIAERWSVGQPYADRIVHTIRVRERRDGIATAEGVVTGAPPSPEVLMDARGPYRVADGRRPWLRPWRNARLAGRTIGTPSYASAVADGLRDAGLSPAGSDALRIDVDPEGEIRLRLDGVTEDVSRMFAESLDEVLAPLAEPRYVVPRYLLDDPGWSAGWRLLVRALRPDGIVWHAVPSVLGVNARRTRAYQRAWNTRVSGGTALYTGSAAGAGVLAA
ncbi:MAG TPA: DEAD/DEAH box helicase, partial [Nocardioidaceae bacterium]|nr:DEAD/DEAH box helicase [Nocardioidaceae bacterium]